MCVIQLLIHFLCYQKGPKDKCLTISSEIVVIPKCHSADFTIIMTGIFVWKLLYVKLLSHEGYFKIYFVHQWHAHTFSMSKALLAITLLGLTNVSSGRYPPKQQNTIDCDSVVNSTDKPARFTETLEWLMITKLWQESHCGGAMGHVAWEPLLRLLSWYPAMNHFVVKLRWSSGNQQSKCFVVEDGFIFSAFFCFSSTLS